MGSDTEDSSEEKRVGVVVLMWSLAYARPGGRGEDRGVGILSFGKAEGEKTVSSGL